MHIDWGSSGAATSAPIVVPENTVGRKRGDTRIDGVDLGIAEQLRNVGRAAMRFGRTDSISGAQGDQGSHAASLVADQQHHN